MSDGRSKLWSYLVMAIEGVLILLLVYPEEDCLNIGVDGSLPGIIDFDVEGDESTFSLGDVGDA